MTARVWPRWECRPPDPPPFGRPRVPTPKLRLGQYTSRPIMGPMNSRFAGWLVVFVLAVVSLVSVAGASARPGRRVGSGGVTITLPKGLALGDVYAVTWPARGLKPDAEDRGMVWADLREQRCLPRHLPDGGGVDSPSADRLSRRRRSCRAHRRPGRQESTASTGRQEASSSPTTAVASMPSYSSAVTHPPG